MLQQGRTVLHQCRGRGVDVWRGTRPARTLSLYLTCKHAVSLRARPHRLLKVANRPNTRTLICHGVDFVPVAVETSGAWGREGWALVKELGRRIGIVKQEPRSTDWLRQRISLAIQRGNAFSILATHPATTTDVLI